MLRRLPSFRFTLVSMLIVPVLLSPTRAAAATPGPDSTATSTAGAQRGPDYQRYITFHNDFDFPIYPVIQVPADLCDGSQVTSVRRILVNGVGHTGLESQETLTVLIPNEKQDVTINGAAAVRRCWYQSGRIYIFPVDIAKFEAAGTDDYGVIDTNHDGIVDQKETTPMRRTTSEMVHQGLPRSMSDAQPAAEQLGLLFVEMAETAHQAIRCLRCRCTTVCRRSRGPSVSVPMLISTTTRS